MFKGRESIKNDVVFLAGAAEGYQADFVVAAEGYQADFVVADDGLAELFAVALADNRRS